MSDLSNIYFDAIRDNVRLGNELDSHRYGISALGNVVEELQAEAEGHDPEMVITGDATKVITPVTNVLVDPSANKILNAASGDAILLGQCFYFPLVDNSNVERQVSEAAGAQVTLDLPTKAGRQLWIGNRQIAADTATVALTLAPDQFNRARFSLGVYKDDALIGRISCMAEGEFIARSDLQHTGRSVTTGFYALSITCRSRDLDGMINLVSSVQLSEGRALYRLVNGEILYIAQNQKLSDDVPLLCFPTNIEIALGDPLFEGYSVPHLTFARRVERRSTRDRSKALQKYGKQRGGGVRRLIANIGHKVASVAKSVAKNDTIRSVAREVAKKGIPTIIDTVEEASAVGIETAFVALGSFVGAPELTAVAGFEANALAHEEIFNRLRGKVDDL